MNHDSNGENELDLLNDQDREHALDLLILKATDGISDTEQHKLDLLLPATEQESLGETIEFAATAASLALQPREQAEIPTALRNKVLDAAGDYFANQPTQQTNSATELANIEPPEPPAKNQVELAPRKSSQGFTWRESIAILVAAASLLLVLSGFNPFSESNNSAGAGAIAKQIPADQQMATFLQSRPDDTLELTWTPVHNKSAAGRVIWSDDTQEGYMVFTGMETNDPSLNQYQLWIFDTDRAQAAPVDGGVFDITEAQLNANGEVIIPIKAHVKVDKAVQFAVTVERPGGVYVSKRENIPVLATLPE